MRQYSLPAPAKVEAFKYPADMVFPADSERCRVIFAIADVQKADVAHQCGVESPGSAQTVYPQGVIVAVFIGPFAMVDEPWRNLIQD